MEKKSEQIRDNLALNIPVTPTDALAQLSEVLGKNDAEIQNLFPDLAQFNGKVMLDLTKDEPLILSIEQADKKLNTYIQLWYGYDFANGKAKNLIDSLPDHPRNKIRKVLQQK